MPSGPLAQQVVEIVPTHWTEWKPVFPMAVHVLPPSVVTSVPFGPTATAVLEKGTQSTPERYPPTLPPRTHVAPPSPVRAVILRPLSSSRKLPPTAMPTFEVVNASENTPPPSAFGGMDVFATDQVWP